MNPSINKPAKMTRPRVSVKFNVTANFKIAEKKLISSRKQSRPIVNATYKKLDLNALINDGSLTSSELNNKVDKIKKPHVTVKFTKRSNEDDTVIEVNSRWGLTDSDGQEYPFRQPFSKELISEEEKHENFLESLATRIVLKKGLTRGSLLNPDVVPAAEEYSSDIPVIEEAKTLVSRQRAKQTMSLNKTPRLNRLYFLSQLQVDAKFYGNYYTLDEIMVARFRFLSVDMRKFLATEKKSYVTRLQGELAIISPIANQGTVSKIEGCFVKTKHLNKLNRTNPSRKTGGEYVVNYDEDRKYWSFFDCGVLENCKDSNNSRHASDFEFNDRYVCMKWAETEISSPKEPNNFDNIRGNGVFYVVLDIKKEILRAIYRSNDSQRGQEMVLNYHAE